MNALTRRFFVGLCTALALYSWLGFFVLPSFALSIGNTLLSEYSTEPASIQRIEFNPFTLELNVWQLHIGDSETSLAFDELQARVAWDSLWRSRIHLHTVHLTHPRIWLDIDHSGSVNLTQLFNVPETDEQSEPDDSVLPLQIDQTQIHDGTLRFSDSRPRQAVALNFNHLNIELNKLSTIPDEQGQLHLSLQANDGTHMTWQGDVSLEPLSSSGQLSIEHVALSSWWPYAQEFADIDLQSGTLSFKTQYRLTAVPEWQLTSWDTEVQLHQLELTTQATPLLSLEQFAISNVSTNLQKQQLSIGQIASNKLAVRLHIDQQGQLNWLKTLIASKSPDAQEDSAQKTSQSLAELPWHIQLKNLSFTDYSIDFSDQSRIDPVEIQLHALNLELSNFDSREKALTQLNASTHINEEGRLTVSGQINPHTLHSQLQLSAENLDLRPAQAWVTPFAQVELASGLLDAQFDAELKKLEPLHLTAQGTLTLHQFKTRERKNKRDLLKWDSLTLQDISFSQQQDAKLSIKRIITQQPYARFIINEDLSTNLSSVLVEQPESSPSSGSSSNFAYHLGEIQIEDGSAHFADLSLSPHFATAVQNLNGKIGGLDSQKNQPTRIAITGAVDTYAPVSIQGAVMPFDPTQQLDIDVKFKQVELTTLTPYSSKFAGYRIRKGRLNLDLNYQINKGKLNAKNSVLLEQLQLGEAVSSPDAVNLPVRLAVALLKDNRGDIDIQLPISGDLNDPQFSVLPVVWQTLRNLIVRAVSAPFKMLSGLTGSNLDLSQVGFAAGSAELTPESQAILDNLAQALLQRPELKLNIEGTSSAFFDGPSVAEKNLDHKIQLLWRAELQERGKKINEESLVVSERQYHHLLEQLYSQLPQASKKLEGNRDEQLQRMRVELIEQDASNAILLRTLAQDRARLIRAYLVEQGKVEPERLYLIDVNEAAESTEAEIFTQLHLDAL